MRILSDVYEDEIFYAIYSWIDRCSKEGSFFYRQTNILEAYGLTLFKPLTALYQKKVAGEVVSDKDILAFLDNSSSRRTFFTILPSVFLDLLRKASNWVNSKNKRDVIIFADLSKTDGVINILRENTVFLREELPESLVFSFLQKEVMLILFSDYRLSQEDKKDALKAADTMIARLENSLQPLILFGEDYSFYVKKYLSAVWKKELPAALEKIIQAQFIFKKAKIKSLLVDEDRTPCKNLLVQTAKSYGCETYVSCHGEPFGKMRYTPLTADHMFVFGKMQKELFKGWGIPEEKIIMSGNSKYEKYLSVPDAAAKEKICKDFGLSNSKKLILVAPHPVRGHTKNAAMKNSLWQENKTVLETVNLFKDVCVIVKLHPADTYQPQISRLIDGFNNENMKVVKKYDSLFLAKGIDAGIVNASTFSIDCLAYKKPVIVTDSCTVKRYKDLDFFYDGSTKDKLKDALEGILSGRYKQHIVNWQRAADYILNGMDGLASKRIANTILEGK